MARIRALIGDDVVVDSQQAVLVREPDRPVPSYAVPGVVWTYEQPLADAHELTGLMAFFDERTDIFVDGQLLERPNTPWRDRPDA